ncbi:transporter substrate-binding domain-containing protein [Saccharothrix texasensis]|uniref:Glutamate transport system substrate-binding protein n=1 Tax=Saccharothrix texasensis TaxID=103734 RepID=A0A3N1H9L3_9PSEU|nr:transporter substrate-binding domain-containing protein [Saccharothrix texasensis]ROP38972.1 glutamate transport system substrate-binding protein [Saccharothrix texasensis]
MTDRRFSRGLYLVVVSVLLLSACSSSEEPPFPARVNVGSAPSSPGWGFRDPTGARSGFDHDLTEWLGSELNFDPIEVDVVTENRERDLKNNTVSLVIANYSITDYRLEQVEIVGPYMVGHQGFMMLNENASFYDSIGKLAGKTVCATSGSTSADQLKHSLGVKVTIVEKKVYEECRLALHAGDVDVVSTDQLILYGMAKADLGVTIPPSLVFGKEERYGIGLPLGDKARCELIKAKLKEFLVGDLWKNLFESNLGDVVKRYNKDALFDVHKPKPDSLRECRSAPSTTK